VIDPSQHEPTSRRLKFPSGYQIAASDAPLLPWSHVVERLARAHNYWLVTTRPDGRPHATPVWGAWVDDAFYFDGIWTARWARNLATNPAATVHLESGADVVILEGTVEDVVPEPEVAARIVAAYVAKYGSDAPIPEAANGMYRLRLRSARAWSSFPDDATRWGFSNV